MQINDQINPSSSNAERCYSFNSGYQTDHSNNFKKIFYSPLFDDEINTEQVDI